MPAIGENDRIVCQVHPSQQNREFMDVQAQVEAARTAALVISIADRVTLVVTGRDRLTWLNGLVTCDLVRRFEGGARYGLFTARNGRVLADAIVVVDGVRVLVSVPRSVAPMLREHLEHYIVMEDAELDARTDAFEAWVVHGPRAADVLSAARKGADEGAAAVGGVLDRTGLGGAVVFASREHADATRSALLTAVRALGGAYGDAAGWAALRVERGVPEFGVDFDATTYPQEAGLERVAVSFDKGCYLGQEVVCMLEMRGQVRRKLAALVFDGPGELPSRGAIAADESGQAVGEVTSSVYSPTLGVPVGFAMLRRASAEPGASVVVAGARAQVVERPA
jgi:folate-binding protein YgfZ